jgi:hypothetical protein|nr:MAG TPA: hypothetical protein [Caudoviricetes sp.]
MTETHYNQIKSVLAWSHGEYTEEQLRKLPASKLSEVYNRIYYQRIVEIETIRK